MQKRLISFICVLGVLAILGCALGYTGLRWMDWQLIQSQQKILQRETKKANQAIPVKTINYHKGDQTSYLLPVGEDSPLYQFMTSSNQEAVAKAPLRKGEVALVRLESKRGNLKDVQQFLVHRVLYRKKLLSYDKLSDKIIGQAYFDKDKNRFSLGKLLNEQMTYLDEQVKKLFPDKNIGPISADLQDFTYKQSKLLLDKEKVEIPISDLFEIVNSDYLTESDLVAYKEYKAKKESEAKNPATGKVVALTFDDGPNSATTPKVLDILAKYKAKATFFVLGSKVAGNEAILKRMTEAGCEIGNHSWDHPSLSTLSADQIKWQIDSTNQAVSDVIGSNPKIVRPPYGATNETVKSIVGVPQVLWSVDTLDWKNHDTQAILANVQSQIQAGAIILMHDIHQTTVAALPTVMDYLVSQGYQFVTVSELYGY